MKTLIFNESVLSLILRIILGVLFFFQGYDKVVRIGMKGVVATFREEFVKIKLPNVLLVSSAWLTSYIELIGGLFLLVGFFKTTVLYFLGLDLILVSVAFSMISPMWDMGNVFPRLILLIILLFLPEKSDVLSFDHLINYFIMK